MGGGGSFSYGDVLRDFLDHWWWTTGTSWP